ncbi:MAG: TIGR00159 family protein [Planctomycetes bacterium]|nr:TIGR00159 family protein [Planctomycetota bacterium]
MRDLLETLRSYLVPLTLEAAIEILIIYLILYTFLRFMEGTRGEGILKGMALLILTVPILVTIIADRFDVLDRLLVIVKFFGAAAIPVLVIIVQPELRRALVRLGQTRIFGFFLRGETEDMVGEIVKAVFRMSRRKTGALIAIEREVGLQNYVERGTQLDARISSEVLCAIFFPGSDLHDGAVVIQKDRIAAAGCLFPLSESPNLGVALGTRHRAALGITEESDAVVIAVSEETGIVSFVHRGKMERPLGQDRLRTLLLKHYAQLEEGEVEGSTPARETTRVGGGRPGR